MKKTVILLLIIVLNLSLCSCGNANKLIRGSNADVINSSASMSLNEFNQIETGMTYEEVCEIVGGEGTLSSSVDLGEYKTEMYMWTGDGTIGANANVTFQQGKVISKSQLGLQ